MYIEDNSAAGGLSVYRDERGYCVVKPDGDIFATMGKFLPPDEALNGARMIAAALDLLEALEDAGATLRNVLLHHGQDMEPSDLRGRQLVLERARSAVAKARGG